MLLNCGLNELQMSIYNLLNQVGGYGFVSDNHWWELIIKHVKLKRL